MEQNLSKENNQVKLPLIVVWGFLIIGCLLLLINLSDLNQVADELFHFDQLNRIKEGKEMVKALTVIPGYHYIVYFFMSIFNSYSLVTARVITFFLSLPAVFFTYKILKEFKDVNSSYITILTFSSFLVLPFFFVVYTDIMALTFILASFYFALNKKYHVAGIIGILSLLIRQTNILWIGFIYFYSLFEYMEGRKITIKEILGFLKPSITFIACIVLFIHFVIWNDGIALGDKSSHPAFTLSLVNSIFFLFCFVVVMLPHSIVSAKDIYQRLISSPLLWLVGILIFLLIFFWSEFPHHYNKNPAFLRNVVLIWVQRSFVFKVLFSLICTYSFLVLIVTKLRKEYQYLLYPIFLLLISSSTLVEQRYYMIGYVFIVLFFKDIKAIKIQLMYSVISFGLVWYIINQGMLFL